MSSKVAELKQSLSFRSLRLMNSRESNIRSFSDSETFNCGFRSSSKVVTESKYKSETDLNSLKDEDGKVVFSHDFLETFSSSDALFKILKKAEVAAGGLKNITSRERESKIRNEVPTCEKYTPISITEDNMLVDNLSNANLSSDPMDTQHSSPYPVLENELNSSSKPELFLGEPRCLALKKNDINPFLSDDPLIFEPDFEDENMSCDSKPTLPKNVEQKLENFAKDMFVDEDEISGTKKKGSLMDREEGELTPEAPPKSSNTTQEPSSCEKKATLEFFNKINECLRDLNDRCREFYSSSTPDYSLTHLQRTLGNVDNIKRKLAYLIKTKNTEKEEKDKAKKNAYRSHANMRLYSERLAKSNSIANDPDKPKHYSDLKSDVEELYRQLKENREKRNSEIISRHSHRRDRSSRGKPSQADLLNRKKTSILEKLGTKQEIERVQSLLKRQMNLITQHVIQKKEIDKKHASRQDESQRRRKRRYSSQLQEEQESKKSRDRVSLNELKTLEDMEAFLDSLKKDKMLCEQYMDDEKSKGLLKFSTKKQKRLISDAPSETASPALIQTIKDSKETFKQPSNKETFEVATIKPSKKQGENLAKFETKQKIDEIKMKHPKNTTPILASRPLSHFESSNQPKEADLRDSNLDSRSKSEMSTDQTKLEEPMIETQKHIKTHLESISNLKSRDFNTEETELKERLESPHVSHKSQNVSEKDKQVDTKRKREDISDSNCNKSENENEEKNCKKQKGMTYLAARRISEDSQLQSKYNPRDEKTIAGTAESLVKDLLSRKVVILDDNGVALNNEFCIKVIDNEVFLKKVSTKKKRKNAGRSLKSYQSKNPKRSKKVQTARKENFEEPKSNVDQKPIEPKLDQETIEPEIDPETIDATLNEMENFLQDLRSKRKVHTDENHHPIENSSQNREMKFLARIQAKRKAKLMACVSEGVYTTEKEAKFLKAFEKKDEDFSESSDIETRKQAFLEKIRAEKDAIAEKPKAKQNDDDPLKDVKAFLDMIKEAESGNEENAKQVYVSFSLKRSDVKKLENLTTGKTSLLTEESQKFLNSVRSKMKAKKAPSSGLSVLMRKPVT